MLKTAATILSGAALFSSSAGVPPPSQPGPWRLLGKAPTSRINGRLHVSRTVRNMKALAFVVASPSARKIHVVWASYCEFNSDDDYTESYSGKLSGVGRITSYPHVFDGATLCDIAVNTDPVKGARVSIGVFSY